MTIRRRDIPIDGITIAEDSLSEKVLPAEFRDRLLASGDARQRGEWDSPSRSGFRSNTNQSRAQGAQDSRGDRGTGSAMFDAISMQPLVPSRATTAEMSVSRRNARICR